MTSDITNNDIHISPFVKSLSSGIKIPADYDYKKARADYLDSPLSFTTLDYVLNKYETSESVLNKLQKFKIICEVCEVNKETLDKTTTVITPHAIWASGLI